MKMTKKGEKKIAKVFREYGKGGPVVKSRAQATAIAMSEARKAMKKK